MTLPAAIQQIWQNQRVDKKQDKKKDGATFGNIGQKEGRGQLPAVNVYIIACPHKSTTRIYQANATQNLFGKKEQRRFKSTRMKRRSVCVKMCVDRRFRIRPVKDEMGRSVKQSATAWGRGR